MTMRNRDAAAIAWAELVASGRVTPHELQAAVRLYAKAVDAGEADWVTPAQWLRHHRHEWVARVRQPRKPMRTRKP